MKTHKMITKMLISLTLLAMSAYAEPEGESSLQASLQELAALGGGVHKVKSEGRQLKSCVIVGEARISTVLGVGKGLSTARRNAQLNAEGAFVSWLKTNVSSVRSSGDETVFELSGSSDTEGETEVGQSTESSMEQITSAAQGAIRGMTLIGEYRDSEMKQLYRVYAWKPGFAELATDAEQAMDPVVEPRQYGAQGGQAIPPAAPRRDNPGFESRTLVAPEAAEFL